MNVLVMGLAKSGTTVVANSALSALGAQQYIFEPQSVRDIEHKWSVDGGSAVVKVLFEHWNKIPYLRRAVVANETEIKFDKRVYIVRDPRDILISRIHYWLPWVQDKDIPGPALEQLVAIFRRKEEAPQSLPVVEMLNEIRALTGCNIAPDLSWSQPYWTFVRNEKLDCQALRYEDFVSGRTEEIQTYLGCSALRQRTDRHTYVTRSKTSNNWKSYFTDRDVQFFRSRFGPLLAEMGYEDWSLTPQASLDAATGSIYVKSLIDQGQKMKAGALPAQWERTLTFFKSIGAGRSAAGGT